MSNNIVKQSQLKEIIDYSWTKTKERYDDAFIDAEIPTGQKKITFTKRKSGTTKDVSLEDYARLQDRNEFKQDVSADDGAIDTTLKCGTLNGNHNLNRVSGHRSITTKAFVDGYIKHLIVLADETQNVGETSNWEIWAIKKGATRAADRVAEKITENNVVIKSMPINGTAQKVVELPIDKKFSNEVYFLVRCVGKNYKVINIATENQNDDCINLSNPPGNNENDAIEWGTNAKDNIAVIFLVGRESIKSLSEKIDKANADSSAYVKHSETTDGTDQETKAGKVLKLDNNGKINSDLLPAVAINEFISVSGATWQESIITREYQNGDVIFHTDTQKRYLCVDRTKPFDNGRFVELNSKDGIITSINGYRPGADGNIVVTATQNGTGITMTFGSTGGTPVTVATYMTDQEVTEIKNLFV
mgnify:CR=1 FL=1